MFSKNIFILISVFLMIGCGGSSSDSPTSSPSTSSSNDPSSPSSPSTVPAKVVIGKFVDSEVEGITYKCSSSIEKKSTTSEGKYSCNEGAEVTFSLGSFVLGKVTAVKDAVVTPYTLFPNNEKAALNLARVLQTFDTDGNPDNGITLKETVIDVFAQNLKNNSVTLEDLNKEGFEEKVLSSLPSGKILVSEADALVHLQNSLEKFITVEDKIEAYTMIDRWTLLEIHTNKSKTKTYELEFKGDAKVIAFMDNKVFLEVNNSDYRMAGPMMVDNSSMLSIFDTTTKEYIHVVEEVNSNIIISNNGVYFINKTSLDKNTLYSIGENTNYELSAIKEISVIIDGDILREPLIEIIDSDIYMYLTSGELIKYNLNNDSIERKDVPFSAGVFFQKKQYAVFYDEINSKLVRLDLKNSYAKKELDFENLFPFYYISLNKSNENLMLFELVDNPPALWLIDKDFNKTKIGNYDTWPDSIFSTKNNMFLMLDEISLFKYDKAKNIFIKDRIISDETEIEKYLFGDGYYLDENILYKINDNFERIPIMVIDRIP